MYVLLTLSADIKRSRRRISTCSLRCCRINRNEPRLGSQKHRCAGAIDRSLVSASLNCCAKPPAKHDRNGTGRDPDVAATLPATFFAPGRGLDPRSLVLSRVRSRRECCSRGSVVSVNKG